MVTIGPENTDRTRFLINLFGEIMSIYIIAKQFNYCK